MTFLDDLKRTTIDLIQHIEASASRLERFKGMREKEGRGDPAPLLLLRRETHMLLRRCLILTARAMKAFARYRLPGG